MTVYTTKRKTQTVLITFYRRDFIILVRINRALMQKSREVHIRNLQKWGGGGIIKKLNHSKSIIMCFTKKYENI